jgi:pyruvate dehydrogenase E2 component (dihydrolipoamide acetyltransferase)
MGAGPSGHHRRRAPHAGLGVGIMADLKPFTMPKWGIEMTEGTIAKWEVEEGKQYAKGDLLTLIETDKISNEVEAEADGCLVRLIAEEQETYNVGALLGVIGPVGTPAADIDTFIASFVPVGADPSGDDAAQGMPDETPSPSAAPVPAETGTIAHDVAISPAARIAAEAAGLTPGDITPSGRNGRITKQDVDKAIAVSSTPKLSGPIAAPGQEDAFASPLARRIAVLNSVDLAGIEGTGPRGRICKADVLAKIGAKVEVASPSAKAALPPAITAGEVEIVKMSAMRRTIAQRLTSAKQEIPHIYLRRRVRVDRLLKLRDLAGKPGTINDYLIRACALALREVPAVNIQVHGNEIHRFGSADIAVAVATDRGLITPIVKQADNLSVAEIGRQVAALAQRARSGKLEPSEYQGGSFSLSNLGSFGVEEFDAIINPPQGAILAVGRARPEPVEDDGAIRVVPVLHLSLSCDHRAIDGVVGAQFLEALANLIEAPAQL